MATVTRGFSFGATEQVTNTKLHTLVDSSTVTNIVNADCDSGMALADTKLAQITTASKVHGSSITALTSLPSGAGVIPTANLPTFPAIRSGALNLRMTTNASDQCTVTADQLILQDISGVSVLVTSFNKTLDLDSSGAGGVSTGAKAANTIYHVWAIRKSSDGTTALVAATTGKSLTTVLSDVGASYDQGALVSVIGTNNSSAIIDAIQQGDKYVFKTWAVMKTGTIGTWSSTYASFTLAPTNMTTNPGFVPNTLSDICFGSANPGSNNIGISNKSAPGSAAADFPDIISAAPNASTFWQFQVLTADTLYAVSNGSSSIYLQGFYLNKLGF